MHVTLIDACVRGAEGNNTRPLQATCAGTEHRKAVLLLLIAPHPCRGLVHQISKHFHSRLQFFEMPTFRLLAFFRGLEREGVVTIEAAMGRTLVAVAALLAVLLPRDAAAQSTKYTKGDPVPLYANKVPQSAVLARSWWAADAQSTRAFAKSGRALCESE